MMVHKIWYAKEFPDILFLKMWIHGTDSQRF